MLLSLITDYMLTTDVQFGQPAVNVTESNQELVAHQRSEHGMQYILLGLNLTYYICYD